jgi:hypothetical protein
MAYPLTSLETLTFIVDSRENDCDPQDISYTFFFNLIIRFYTVLSSGLFPDTYLYHHQSDYHHFQ